MCIVDIVGVLSATMTSLLERPSAAAPAATAVVTAPTVTGQAAPPPQPRERDPWPDNAKLVLVGLVVLGHTLSRGIQQTVPSAHALYLFVYLFHMPAFVFLAGHFAHARTLTRPALQKIVTRVLAPYVIFTVIYAVVRAVTTGHHVRIDLVNPWWLLWFLPALAGWRLLSPVLLNLRAPVTVALLIGLGSGMLERVGAPFTLARILALLPFFVLGATTPPDWLRLLRYPSLRWAGAVVLAGTAVAVALLHTRVDGAWDALFWNGSYAAQGVGTVEGLLTRAALYVVGAALTFSVLAVIPGGRRWYTAIGAASLYVYLLHGFAVRAAAKSGLLDEVTSWWTVGLVVVATGALALALGSPPVRRLARPLVEPRLRWLLRPL
jgi:fucose 4-O-acetylase-like acetyltransferase